MNIAERGYIWGKRKKGIQIYKGKTQNNISMFCTVEKSTFQGVAMTTTGDME